MHSPIFFIFFFFNATATTEIYTLSLHDALPILTEEMDSSVLYEAGRNSGFAQQNTARAIVKDRQPCGCRDRKSTRLNSSHTVISYAVFCLKKKKKKKKKEK